MKASGSYFSIVNSPFSFHITSRDILQRWSYPLVPDIPMLYKLGSAISPLSGSKSMKTNTKPSIGVQFRRYGTCITYIGDKVTIGTEVKIEGHVLIGANSVIGSGSVLIDCVLGPGSVVNTNAVIKNSIIFSSSEASCIIGNNVVIHGSLLAPGTKVSDGVRIENGTMLGTWTNHPIQICSSISSEYARWISSDLVSFFSKSKSKSKSCTQKTCHHTNYPTSMFFSSDEEEIFSSPSQTLVPWTSSIARRLSSEIKKGIYSSLDSPEIEGNNEDGSENNDEGWKLNLDESELSFFVSSLVPLNWLNLSEPLFFSNKKAPWVEEAISFTSSQPKTYELRTEDDAINFNKKGESNLNSVSAINSSTSLTQTGQQFASEIAETLRHALDYVADTPEQESTHESSDLKVFVENTCVEINALKFAFNADFLDVRKAVIPVIVKHSLTGICSSKIQQVRFIYFNFFLGT